MAEKQNTPKLQNTSDIDTDVFVKGMTKDPDSSMITKEQWTHARNAINNSVDGDLGTLGNEPANKQCSSAPFTIIGAIHLYGDKWVLFSTNNQQSEIGTWDDSECKYERIVNDFSCYQCLEQLGGIEETPCLNFNTQHLITGASKENFDCSWQVYWDDGVNPSRTLNLDNIPWKQNVISDEGADCVIYEDAIPLCLDCEKIRLAPLIDIPCIELSKSVDGGQLRNGSYQVYIAYVINDQKIGDYYGISNIQPLFAHEDMLSGLEIKISNLDKEFEYYELVIARNTQGEQTAKQIGFYSTEQTNISIDYINEKLPSKPLGTLPLTTPAYERSDKMYVVNDYLIRQGPTEQFDFNYQPLANNIHVHYTVTEFPDDYYAKGGNKPTFMRDEVYSFFIRFVYNTGEKSASYHIPGRAPYNWPGITDPAGNNPNVLDPWPGNNDLGTALWNQNGGLGTADVDRLFEVHNTADDGWNPAGIASNTLELQTDDGGRVIREGHMAYWESTERYPQDPVRWGDLCGQPIRHHKMPDETTAYVGMFEDPTGATVVNPNNFLDRTGQNNATINVLGVRFTNIAWPRFNASSDELCGPDNGAPTGPRIPNIVGYEILVGSREGNKSIIAKGITRNMRRYNLPNTSTGHEIGTGNLTGYMANYPFNDCNADPYLSAGNDWTYTRNGGIVNPGGNYTAGDTATNIFTFHSPDTSFNKPFLSPYELKSYGICTGTQVGNFVKSEKHPQHKLLRNISMWIAIIVGAGYAIGEMRGKKNKKMIPPKALNVGLVGFGEQHGGNRTTIVNTPSTSFANGWTAIATTTSASFNENTTARSGGRQGSAAPYDDGSNVVGGVVTGAGTSTAPTWAPIGSLGRLDTDGDQFMMANYNTNLANPLTGINSGAGGQGVLLSTATVAGAPKLFHSGSRALGMNIGYEPNVRNNMRNWGPNRGYIGAGEEWTYEGTRFESMPSLTQILFGAYQFMMFTAEGGQVIIDLIYNLVSYQDYAWKYNSQGLYWSTQQRSAGGVFRQLVNKGRYVGSSMQNLTANIRINNVQRPKTVVINTVTNGADFDPIGTFDQSRFCIGPTSTGGILGAWFNPGAEVNSTIGAHYCALKTNFTNQYGQIDQIKQIPVGCITYFADQIKPEDDHSPRDLDDMLFTTDIVYGGDCYINRYSEKVIMPFFWDFQKDMPDGMPYDYKLRANVPRPVFWMDTKKFELSQLVRDIVNFGWLISQITGGGGGGLSNSLPSGLFVLDRPTGDLGGDDGTNQTTGAGGIGAPSGGGPGALANAPNMAVSATQDNNRRSIFHVVNGYMYTHCNGVNEFYCESPINTAFRDWEDVDEKRHYDRLEYTDVDALFHADIIKKDNYYKYDTSLSKSRFNTQLISYGFIQARDYDPLVAEDCYTHYPKRLMYSLQAQLEAKKDFWRVFLPYNYKDFKNKVNVIKPVSKSGAMILFPHLSPVLWQGVDQLETDLGTKLTIGDGGLFSQPPQAIVNADLPHEYGSCESARSVVNTPSGLFFISQAQGKIFQYTQGLTNIADQGMKQWFNKYLPSILLKQFPEMEHCDSWIDNPVAGVGCQSVYDPNYDLVYFSKKDFECTLPECIDYVPCEGFVYNHSKCENVEPQACCPEGDDPYNPYVFVPGGPTCPPGFAVVSCLNGSPCCTDYSGNPPFPATITEPTCERIITLPAEEDQSSGQVDIVFAVDSSNSVDGAIPQNVGNMQNFVRTMITELNINNGITNGDIRVGLIHFGGGRAVRFPLFNGQQSSLPNSDEMFEFANQITLTNSVPTLLNWIGNPGAWNGTFHPADYRSTYGAASNSIANGGPSYDLPYGTDILAGIWGGQNLLYGLGARACPKVLITIFDGPMGYKCDGGGVAGANNPLAGSAGAGFFYTNTPYSVGGITGPDTFNGMTVPDPALVAAGTPAISTPDIRWDDASLGGGYDPCFNTNQGFAQTANAYDAQWFETNVRAAGNYTQQVPFIQKNYSIVVDPQGSAPTATHIAYSERYAGGGGLLPADCTFGGSFSNIAQIQAIAQDIITAITPPPVYSCPPGCDLVTTSAGQFYCECIDYLDPEYIDITSPVNIEDDLYFKDVSWTVSYDPKYKAWMSFHDWHPQLMIPSLNHFFTTNTYEDLESQPSCPPGFTWNPTTQTCCQTYQGEFEADIIVDEVPVEIDIDSIPCKIDIVLALDASGSMGLGADGANDNWNAAEIFINEFVFNLADEMIIGNIQIGLNHWSNPTFAGINAASGLNPITNDTYPSIGNGNTDVIGGVTYTYAQAVVPDGTGGLSMTNNPRLVYDASGSAVTTQFCFATNPQQGTATEMAEAYQYSQNQLWEVKASALGDRTLDPGYRRILVFISDGGDFVTHPLNPVANPPNMDGTAFGNTGGGALHSPPSSGGGMITPQNNTVDWSNNNVGGAGTDALINGQQVHSQNITIFASNGGGAPAAGSQTGYEAVANCATYGTCNNMWDVDTGPGCNPLQDCPSTVASAISSNLCTLPPVCICPPGYERITSNLDGTAPPHQVYSDLDDCEPERAGICRKLECECDVANLPIPTIPTTTTGNCPTDILNGIALYYNEDTFVGDPSWTGYSSNPVMCHYDYECCVEGTTIRGGIWKHNDRCDLFANYYGKNYPWEVEWVETVGQSVNTIRSIEYQLESYIYKGNLADDCGDRFHDLDWNFDEAIIHNTEQVSGLLRFNLDPKNNVPLITEYPIITGNDIQILYSKVEQKYRFNQFWDITRDRGEFDPNWNSSIFITQLNGYIRDLNQANLDYFKPSLQRKKFRHYWNKVVLRKNISGNRKMIFKLANTKINASFR